MENYQKYLNAKKYYYSHEYQKAIDIIKTFINDKNFKNELTIILANCHLKLENEEAFEDLLIKALNDVPDNEAEVLDLLLKYYYDNKMMDKINIILNEYSKEPYLPRDVELVLNKYSTNSITKDDNSDYLKIFEAIDKRFSEVVGTVLMKNTDAKELVDSYLSDEKVESYLKYALLFILKDNNITWSVNYFCDNKMYIININEIKPIESSSIYIRAKELINNELDMNYASLIEQANILLRNILIELFPNLDYNHNVIAYVVLSKLFRYHQIETNNQELQEKLAITKEYTTIITTLYNKI